MYCIQTAEDIVKLLSLPGSPIILVFRTRVLLSNFNGNLFIGGLNTGVGGKISDFRLKLSFISETARDRPMVAIGELMHHLGIVQ